MLLSPDRPAGRPPFSLYDDEIATVVDLACRGAAEARQHVKPGMIEVPITRLVRKGIVRVKRGASLSNVQLRAGELELDDMASTDPTVLGRIDITLQFVLGRNIDAAAQDDGFMVGFVLALPAEATVAAISGRVRSTYGEEAQLLPASAHPASLAVLSGRVLQRGSHAIRVHHMLVDMTPAA